jgi:tetratricopeptide (TPR) repeat protein
MVGQQRTKKQPISLKKKVGFALLATCLFFLILEGMLTLAGVETSLERDDPYVGFESSIPLFVEEAGSGGRILKTAPNKLTWFNPQRFRKNKAHETFRIFCLGGSTTFGRPYDDSTSFCSWLREFLDAAGADRNVEVINAGGISYASYRVAAVMEELSQYNPDLFIVYCGHNEFLEERAYRDLRDSSETQRGLSLLLHRTRTFRLARNLFSNSEPPKDERFILPAEVDAILDHTAGPISYHRDDRKRNKILKHFRLNLTRMIRTASEAGAELVFVTPAANTRDFSPFKSESLSTLSQAERRQWTALVAAAADHQAKGEFRQSIEKLEAAASIDPRHAEVRYQLGLLLFGQQQYQEAEREFQAAIDNDVCPLRATSNICRIVRQTATAHRVPLVDFVEILRNDCLRKYGHGSPGNEYFLDHVHPTIGGHRLLAMAIVDAMIQMRIVTPSEDWPDEPLAAASREIESRIDPELNAQALTNLSQVLNWAGKSEEAGRLAVEAVDMRAENQLDDDPESLFYAAKYLATSGETSRAKTFFERVLRLQPDIERARWHLARLFVQEDSYDEAKRELVQLVDSEPDNPRYLQSLGQVLLELELLDEAMAAFERANAINPELPGLQEDVAYARENLESRTD